ncbi:putative acyl-CoA thioester hydrolase [BD1-7 clade bacterium]|uniref:Putative acyl-CoA thioester hydrolase n=1 Tax=BD1-7 clade bacterium TaxID=2029982 RepID=A0A5S9QKU9_9GAMM|nr:putative acyl-CoA thioester hydrolase [BD1-7 clade bacterium]
MEHKTRRVVMYSHLNSAGVLFGGQALAWIDEESAIFAACQMGTTRIVTKKMSEVEFNSPAKLGEILSIGSEIVRVGRTSITVACEIRNKSTDTLIVKVDEVVFVALDENNKPTPHRLASSI